MSSPPWMPLDIDDYLADTAHLSPLEHGAYMLLIMRYWKDAGLPTDERMVARYSRLTPEQWADSRDVLAAFFMDGWRHKRIDAELAKATEIIGKRRSAAEQRHAKSNAHAEQVQSTSTYTGVPPSPSPSTASSLRSDGEETRGKRAHVPATGFDDFWTVFPNKVGKADAVKAFSKALTVASAETIMVGLRRYASKTDDRPWCNPATFLNQARWEDQPATVQPMARGSPATGKPKSTAEILSELGKDMRHAQQGGDDWADAGEFPRIGYSR